MDPTKEIADALYRDRIRQARRTSMTEKFFDGGDLFDDVCARMRTGIRERFPDADESEVQAILVRQLDRLRRLEERGVYRPVDDNHES